MENAVDSKRTAYQKGYNAAARRVEQLKREIDRLRKMTKADPGHDETVEYLIDTAETLTAAAEALMKIRSNPKEGGVSDEAENDD